MMIGLGAGLINAVVWGVLFGGGGLFLLYYGWNLNKKPKMQVAGWTRTKGKVVSVQVNRTPTDQSGFRVTFVPVINYSYETNGQTYTANNLATAPTGYDSVTAQRVANRYPAGKTVEISYNPTNPSQSLLDVNPASGNFYLMAGVGLLVIAVIVVCVIMSFSLFASHLAGSF